MNQVVSTPKPSWIWLSLSQSCRRDSKVKEKSIKTNSSKKGNSFVNPIEKGEESFVYHTSFQIFLNTTLSTYKYTFIHLDLGLELVLISFT